MEFTYLNLLNDAVSRIHPESTDVFIREHNYFKVSVNVEPVSPLRWDDQDLNGPLGFLLQKCSMVVYFNRFDKFKPDTINGKQLDVLSLATDICASQVSGTTKKKLLNLSSPNMEQKEWILRLSKAVHEKTISTEMLNTLLQKILNTNT